MDDNYVPPQTGPVKAPPESTIIDELLYPTQQPQGTYNTVGYEPAVTKMVADTTGGRLIGRNGIFYNSNLSPFNKPIMREVVVKPAKPIYSGPNINPAYKGFAEYAKTLLNPYLFRT